MDGKCSIQPYTVSIICGADCTCSLGALVWFTLPGSVLVVLDEPRQTKVSDLADQVVSDQDVGGTQVPVDVVHPLDEGHPISDLEQRRGAKRWEGDVCICRLGGAMRTLPHHNLTWLLNHQTTSWWHYDFTASWRNDIMTGDKHDLTTSWQK